MKRNLVPKAHLSHLYIYISDNIYEETPGPRSRHPPQDSLLPPSRRTPPAPPLPLSLHPAVAARPPSVAAALWELHAWQLLGHEQHLAVHVCLGSVSKCTYVYVCAYYICKQVCVCVCVKLLIYATHTFCSAGCCRCT